MKKRTTGGCIMAAVLAAFMAVHPMSTPDDKHLSPAGAKVLLNVEGCEKNPYYCSAGVVTAGVGHTGPDVKITDEPRSELEIAALLHKDVTFFENCVKKRLGSDIVKDMSQGNYDSAVLFSFNSGCGSYRGSSMASDTSKRKFDAACSHYPKWANIRVKGKLVSCFDNRRLCGGVADRRLQEKEICLDKDWPPFFY